MKGKKKNTGITLIALVVTIVVLLILAGITISFIMRGNSVLNEAQNAKEQQKIAEAREKLQMVLMSAQASKQTNSKYDENEFLNKFIVDGVPGANVIGNLAIVDDYIFELDRSVPKIANYVGRAEYNEDIVISAEYVPNLRFEDGKLTNIKVTYEGNISEIMIHGEIVEIPTKTGNEYIIADKTINKNGDYNIVAKDESGKLKIKTITVTDLTEDMNIRNKEEMLEFARKVNEEKRSFKNKKVTVLNEIDLAGSAANKWQAIGAIDNAFEGTFEGNGHKIKGLYIVGTGDSQGLFACNNGIIQNIEIENGHIESTYTTTGMLVGTNNGTVENVKVSGEVIGEEKTGGIAGINGEGASISKCVNVANINKDRTSFSSGQYVGRNSRTQLL